MKRTVKFLCRHFQKFEMLSTRSSGMMRMPRDKRSNEAALALEEPQHHERERERDTLRRK